MIVNSSGAPIHLGAQGNLVDLAAAVYPYKISAVDPQEGYWTSTYELQN